LIRRFRTSGHLRFRYAPDDRRGHSLDIRGYGGAAGEARLGDRPETEPSFRCASLAVPDRGNCLGTETIIMSANHNRPAGGHGDNAWVAGKKRRRSGERNWTEVKQARELGKLAGFLSVCPAKPERVDGVKGIHYAGAGFKRHAPSGAV
jgi:hypothetical protein